jgi:hypothetical protein
MNTPILVQYDVKPLINEVSNFTEKLRKSEAKVTSKQIIALLALAKVK